MPNLRLSGIAVLGLLAGCARPEEDAVQVKPAPATILQSDNGGTILELSSSAAENLNITLGKVEQRSVERSRVFSGELVVPPGARAELHAPQAATVSYGEKLSFVSGQIGRLSVAQGEVLFALTPLLSIEGERAATLQHVQLAQAANDLELARVHNEGARARATARLNSARIAFERAELLVSAQAGSTRARDEARAEVEAAQADQQAADQEHELLAKQSLETDFELATPIDLKAPFAGEVVSLDVASGQSVPAGARLAVLECHDSLWIRVPVFPSALGELADANARLVSSDSRITPEGTEARAIEGLPTADAAFGTVDRWYELPNPDLALRPGQRVSVALPLVSEESRLIVPWSAVVIDALGGTWVYEHLGGTRYRRAAVELERALGEEAVLLRGPPTGTRVAQTGAVELFGTEFGGSKE